MNLIELSVSPKAIRILWAPCKACFAWPVPHRSQITGKSKMQQQEVSNKIRATLKASGLSQADLAKKLGISRQQLNNILTGNRKSKYLNQIASLLQMPEIAKARAFKDSNITSETSNAADIQRLPIIFPEDILRIWEGHQSINQLNKPFYNFWPFVKESGGVINHFCLSISDYFTKEEGQTIMGAFHLYLPLNPKKGHIVLLYLKNINKLIIGKLEVNPETGIKSVINIKGIYPIGSKDVLLAECSQTTNFL